MYEVLHHHLPGILASDVLDRMSLRKGAYFVLSCHREENVDDPARLRGLVKLLNWLAVEFHLRIIVSTHPRTRKRLAGLAAGLRDEIELMPPFGFLDYVHLEMNARATLSDSGTISEESSILGFPALNLREAHERPEAMEEASVMMTGFEIERVREGLRILSGAAEKPRCPIDYQAPQVAAKVVRILQSYTGYINRIVWHKA